MTYEAIDYGFSTEQVEYDPLGLPVGLHKVMITDEEIKHSENPNNLKRLVVTYEAVEGKHRGTKHIQSYNLWHANQKTSSIAQQSLKRIADATGREVSPASPLKGRVLVIEIRKQKNNPDYTEVAKYYPESHAVETDDIPFS